MLIANIIYSTLICQHGVEILSSVLTEPKDASVGLDAYKDSTDAGEIARGTGNCLHEVCGKATGLTHNA
jgi:hypothetical protein